MKANRAAIGLLLVILFVISLAFSLDYIAANTDHECTGDECKICAVLQTAEEVSGGAKKAAAAAVTVGTLFAVCLVLRKEHTSGQAEPTPVTRCDLLTN